MDDLIQGNTDQTDQFRPTVMEDESSLNSVAVALLLGMLYLTWAMPRRYAVCPLLVTTCLMPLDQAWVIFGLHFPFYRLVVLVGLLRAVVRGEAGRSEWNRVDRLVIWWAVASVVLGALSGPVKPSLVSSLGDAYDVAGSYFFVRCVVVDFEDIVVGVRTLAFVSVPEAALMLVEKLTSHNLLSIFGGVPEITAIREGHIRCQGAFRHPILAGVVGAAQIPLFVALWSHRPGRSLLAVAGIVSSLIIALTASSSGALMALVAGFSGLALWNYRAHMRLLRWGIVAVLIAMSLLMKAPVWYLLARLSDFTGGTGWHRAFLIDQAIAHFDEWWIVGTTYTAHWGPGGEVIAANPNMMDITNHYIMEGVKGGVLRLVLFVAIIVQCFKGLGSVIRTESPDSSPRFFVWTIGTSMFVHCISFISITYFDQSIILWCWILAVTSFIGSFCNDSSISQTEVCAAVVEQESIARGNSTGPARRGGNGIPPSLLFSVAGRAEARRGKHV